jgi:arsenate reductase-like glutaredoxin family protein
MTAVQIYGRAECPHCAAARNFLSSRGVPVQPHDPITEPPSLSVLERAVRENRESELFDVQAARLAGINPECCSPERVAEWLNREPQALRVPLVVRGNTVVPATDAKRLESLIY